VSQQESLKRVYDDVLKLGQKLGEVCAYQDLLQMANLSAADTAKVRSHITQLAKKLAYL
jgi:hypothetical protein